MLFCSKLLAEDSRLVVSVRPANTALKNNVEGYIGSLAGRDLQALQRLRPMVEKQAQKAAQALGYYQAQISSEVVQRKSPQLKLRIHPGEPVRLSQVKVEVVGPARAMPAFRLPASLEQKPGDRLDHGRYEDIKHYLQNQAARYGFFRSHFTRQQLLIDPVSGQAQIDLLFDSGPRYILGPVSFSGDQPFDDELLQRMVPFQQGAFYDSERIAELYAALRSSGFFESVRVDASPDEANEQWQIPLKVQLHKRLPRTMGLGLGFSTDVGPRGRANWQRHWRNAQGHSYGTELELSAPRKNIGLWYDRPLQRPLTDKLRFAGGYQYEELADTDSLSRLLTLGPEWHSQLESGWQRVISLKWLREEYRLGNDSGLSRLLMPGISYSYLKSDNRMDPNHGYRLQFDVSVAKQGLMADSDVFHSNFSAKGLTTLWQNHRFLARAQFGGTESKGFNSSVPPSLRFFAGGDQSVRGYDYQSLSPVNNRGDKIGARYLFAASSEYQYKLTEKWRVAAFYDTGNAFNSLDMPSLKNSVGIGLRWVSPVGPLRLDLAHALDDGGGIRLHFSMGPEL